MAIYALGLIETKGLIAAIEACDAAAKAAAVVISSAELTDAALVTVKIEGELGAVQAAVEAGTYAAQRVGEVLASHVIPRPDPGLEAITPPRRYVSGYTKDNRPRLTPSEESSTSDSVASGRGMPGAVRVPVAMPARRAQTRTREHEPRSSTTATAVSSHEEGRPVMSRAQLEATPVVQLRQIARKIHNLPIQGRQISMAGKDELIAAIAQVVVLE